MANNTYITKDYLEEKGYVKFEKNFYLFPYNHHASIKRLYPEYWEVDYEYKDRPDFHLTIRISKKEELKKVEDFIDNIIYPLPF